MHVYSRVVETTLGSATKKRHAEITFIVKNIKLNTQRLPYLVTGPLTHSVGGSIVLLLGVCCRRLSSVTLHGGAYTT